MYDVTSHLGLTYDVTQEVDISWCRETTDQVLTQIFENCPKIEKVYIYIYLKKRI